MRTDTGIFSLTSLKKSSIIYITNKIKIYIILRYPNQINEYWITLSVNSGWVSRYCIVVAVWTILASMAEEKSKQKTWILAVRLFFRRLIVQLIISVSTRVGMTLSLMLAFCKIAMQNLWVTLPFSWSFKIYWNRY